jgi:hypothetical protein
LARTKTIVAGKLFMIVCLFPFVSRSQDFLSKSQIHGSFQMDAQYYVEDTLIGAQKVDERILMNAFANLLYTNGDFSAGLRFESYQNALNGYSKDNNGNGIPYRFASYKADELQVTIGNFYEQFGNGLIFRAYQDWSLGIDNSIDGLNLVYNPIKGITLKGLIGTQRLYFDKGPGIIRGADGEFYLNDIIKKWADKKTKVTIGGSVVSKYQEDMDPIYNLPENVAAFAGRMNVACGKINFVSEYAYKVNDPSTLNKNIYKPGEALYVSTSYSKKGLGISLSAKRIDNMNFRSNRAATGNVLIINYLPALTKQHSYTLATMYPYSTQPNGEMGAQAEIIYSIKKNTWLGGKYGTDVTFNYSRANSIDLQPVNDTTAIMESGTLGYKSDFFKIGDKLYFEDVNIEIDHKFSKKIKAVISYMYQTYNKEVIEGHKTEQGFSMIYSHIGILDLSYKIKEKKSVQLELQHLYTREDKKNWVMGMIQYTIAPKWFFSVGDMYNYGNDDKDLRFHYYNVSAGFIKNANRISITYGKQREGLLCVGGVCRFVPASNGITLSIISSF